MIDSTRLYLFIGAAVALLVIPGPAVLYITARSASQGRVAGLVSVLAIETANFIQAVAAGLGLSAILLSSALAINVVKYLGAAYLIYLGVRKLLSQENGTGDEIKQESLPQIYWQGLAVNLLNPKTALFFLAFLPQFVDPAKGHVAQQSLLLGVIFVGLAIPHRQHVCVAGKLSRREAARQSAIANGRAILRRARVYWSGNYNRVGGDNQFVADLSSYQGHRSL